MVTGAVSWPIAFLLGLSRGGLDYWQWRDDAVITLSHALNAVRFGSVGVSPGGNRVEGFSSPLQFIISAAVFAVADPGYQGLLDGLVWGSIVIAGALVAAIAYGVALSRGLTPARAWLASLGATVLVAWLTVTSWTSMGWLASGMENPLILVAALVIMAALTIPVRRSWSATMAIVGLTLLGLTRLEMPVLIMPALIATTYVVSQRWQRGTRRGIRAAIVGIPVAAWALLTVARYAYFGELLPNTAVVQGKASGVGSFAALTALTVIQLALLALAVRRETARLYELSFWLLGAAAAFGGIAAFARVATGGEPLVLGYWYPDPGYGAIAAAIAVSAGLAALATRSEGRPWLPDIALMIVAVIPVVQYATMGPARLDVFRIASIAVPLFAVWGSTSLIRLFVARPTIAVVGLTTAVAIGGVFLIVEPVRTLCCKISPSEQRILRVADAVRTEDLAGTGLPIVASADLGKLSFAKRSVIVDLGWLGDPVLARLHRDHPELEAGYLADTAAPDVVEMHGGWACKHSAWFDSPAFSDNWTQVATFDASPPVPGAGCSGAQGAAIWQRSNASSEWALTRALIQSTNPAAEIRSALAQCATSGDGAFRCQGVRRAATRAADALRRAGSMDAVVAEFSQSPSSAFDIEVLGQGPGWADRATAAYVDLVRGTNPQG